MGAAMIAGGLYGCAAQNVTVAGVRARLSLALGPCMRTPFLLRDIAAYRTIVRQLAARGWIDPPSSLQHARVYAFTGASDEVVNSATIQKATDLYLALGVPTGNVTLVNRSGPAAHAGHAWVTNAFGGACAVTASPFINDCGYNQSEAELRAFYGPDLSPPAPAAAGRIVAFDQTEFVPGRAAAASGLSDTGYLYVPKACETGAAQPCRLQVSLHGCTQSAEKLGDIFYTHIGLNELADANRIVVLYPQTHATGLSDLPGSLRRNGRWALNPNGCWNWWGYGGDAHYLTKKGVQVDAIWRMIERLEGK